jgi:hypothetical protein
LAVILREAGYAVFYDDFFPEQLWGKSLAISQDFVCLLMVVALTLPDIDLTQNPVSEEGLREKSQQRRQPSILD